MTGPVALLIAVIGTAVTVILGKVMHMSQSIDHLTAAVSALETAAAARMAATVDESPAVDALASRVRTVTELLSPAPIPPVAP